jgi:four helix bundle protein
MAKTNFENLRVYKLAEQLADQIWQIVVKWDYFAKSTVGMQIVTAADGVGANISEGTGRGSLQDNRRFINIARGSLYETKHWLRRAYRRKLLTQNEIDGLKPYPERTITDSKCLLPFSRCGSKEITTKNKAQSTKF